LLTFVAPIIFGYFVSVVIRPITAFLTKNLKLGPTISTIAALLILVMLIGFVTTTAISRLIRDASDFYENLPAIAEYTELFLAEIYTWLDGLQQILPYGIQGGIYVLMDITVNAGVAVIGEALGSFGNAFIGAVPRVLFGVVIGFISSYFFSKDRELIASTIRDILPQKERERLILIRKRLLGALGGYFKAQLIIMSAVATIGTIGHFIIGTPYALLLSVTIALVDALPVFGSGIFYWPWMITLFIMGEYWRLVGLVVIYVTTFFTRQFLEPKIVGKEIGIHPILTLSSIYIGINLFGIIGILLGPFFAVIFKTVLVWKN